MVETVNQCPLRIKNGVLCNFEKLKELCSFSKCSVIGVKTREFVKTG